MHIYLHTHIYMHTYTHTHRVFYKCVYTHTQIHIYVYMHLHIILSKKKKNCRNCGSLSVDFFSSKDIFVGGVRAD